MGITSYFYNSIDNDRTYDSSSMENWLKKFFTTGVFKDDYAVVAGSGMAVSVGSGYANINGKVAMSDADASLDLATASGTLNRIDSIVLRRDDTNRLCSLVVIQGSNASTPTPPDIIRANGIYDLRLANIYVKAGAIKITQAEITDMRAYSECGIVASTVTQMNFSQFAAQFSSYFDQFKDNKEVEITTWFADKESAFNTWEDNRKADYETWYTDRQSKFDTWYASIIGKLSGDVATKLTEATTELDSRITALEHMVIDNDITAPLTDDDGAILVDDDGYALLADWQYVQK
jgi:hypothetical protein